MDRNTDDTDRVDGTLITLIELISTDKISEDLPDPSHQRSIIPAYG